MSGSGMSSTTSPVLPTSASSAQPLLTPTEQLMYSAVRLFNQVGQTLHWGSGFLFHLFNMNGQSVPVIVTNKHVVNGWDNCSFELAARNPDGSPDLSTHVPVTITDFQKAFVPHPSIDLAAIPVGRILSDLQHQNRAAFTIGLDPSLIPTDDELAQLLPVEQVLTVGFPGMLWDDLHNLPVFHRGYTSTAPYIDFKGEKKFLIDVATWPGASGSPVFLFNDNGWTDRHGNTMLGATRIKLIGVVYGVGLQTIDGNILIQNAPTQVVVPGQMVVPTNLGACIRASCILDFEPLLVRLGIKPPAGYIMRAK